jgi:oligoribonuclease (3'-5' exoribonuclease)
MLFFVDFETTDKDLHRLHPLELALVAVTDDLETVIDTRLITFRIPDAALVPGEVVAMHTRNGLWDRCLQTADGPSDYDAGIVAWLSDVRAKLGPHIPDILLAGNSVWFDRAVLHRFFPLTYAELSHRQVDLSSLNELARRSGTSLLYDRRPKSAGTHRAMADALESLELARYYAARLGSPAFEASDDLRLRNSGAVK